MFEPILKNRWLRSKLAFELRCFHYEDLEIEVPIGSGIVAPVVNNEYWHSFVEVFFSNEYRPVFEKIELPARWLDLGCHAGFFSLLVLALRRERGMTGGVSALLVDGDSRVRTSIERIISRNRLEGQLQFVHGAIARDRGFVTFEEASVMSSRLNASDAEKKSVRRVPVVSPEEMIAKVLGPYDLIKIDVEGAEHDFLTTYGSVLSQTRHLLLEWHSWHFGGGGLPAIRGAAEAAGLQEVAEIVPGHDGSGGGGTSCGVILFPKAQVNVAAEKR